MMFGQKKQPIAGHVIGASMHVAGDCHFQGDLQVDGTILGNVIADPSRPGSVRIGPSARVEGLVRADDVVVAGAVVGGVLANRNLELRATARIEGDVSYQSMEMQPGASVLGSFQPQLITPTEAELEAQTPEPEPAEIEGEQDLDEPTEPTLDPDQPLAEDDSRA